MDRESHWRGVWSTKADTAVSWFQEDPSLSLALIDRAGLPGGARVVDVGGGASRLVDRLTDRGCSVTVLDLAPEALARSEARLGDRAAAVEWIAADVTRWTPTAAFDLWHDRAVFHFLTEADDRDAYRRVLESAVKPGGAAILGTFAPDGPERCSGLPIVRYDAGALAAAAGPAFTLEHAVHDIHRTPGGNAQAFQFVLLRRGA